MERSAKVNVGTSKKYGSVLQFFHQHDVIHSFAALAGVYSTCPSSSRGGSLGSFQPGTMVAEFDQVVFAPDTKAGEVKGPVKTQLGYHLICVDKRSGGGDWY